MVVSTLAKKYKLPALALLARKHFIEAVKEHRDTVIFHYECIRVIYGAQPEPDSTFRKIVAQKMELDLE